jgi:hypothetical protein
MLELPLLVVLAGAVCFLTYEFFKINQTYQKRMHYYRFLPSLSMSESAKELHIHTANADSRMRMSDIGVKLSEIEARMERQEAVIEKLIKGLGD